MSADRRSEVLGYTGVGAAASAAFLLLYRPFGWRFSVPWSYGLDNLFYAMVVRTEQLEGGYGYAPSLGAPYGQELYDFPQGGNRIHLLAWRVLGRVFDSPFTVLNVWFAITCVLIALVAYGVLKHLGVRPLVAGALGLVYAFVPYRFWHGLQHPPLSAYFCIPLAVLLAVWVVQGTLRDHKVVAVAAAVVIGSSDPYYTIFSVLLVAMAVLFDIIRERRLAPVIAGGVVAAALGFVMVLNLSPEALFRRDHGSNDRVTERLIADSETYALHLTQVVSPSPDHQIGPLAAIGKRAANVNLPGEGGTAITTLGVVGLLLGAGAVLGLLPVGDERRLLIRRLGTWQLGVILMATVGGVSLSLAVAGFTQIRSWGRMSVILSFLCFAVVGLLAQPLLDRLRDRRGSWAPVVAVVVVTGVALFDAVPSGARPNYDTARALVDADRAFVGSMQDALPDGAMVFQLPVVPFPETPLVGMGPYDNARPYILGDDSLRWSFGGVKGRISDWQEVWATQAIERQLRGIAAAGFAALYVDTLGVPADEVTQIEELLGQPDGTAGTGRERWYDLRGFAEDVEADLGAADFERLGAAVTTSIRVEFAGAISGFENVPEGVGQWLGGDGRLVFPNHGSGDRDVTVRFEAVGPAGTTIRATGPGLDRSVRLTGGRDDVELHLTLPEGVSELVLVSDAPANVGSDDIDRRVRLLSLRALDDIVEDVLGPGPGEAGPTPT